MTKVHHDMIDAMADSPKQKTVDCIQETQTTSATTLGSHVSCAQETMPSLDKGKHKMYKVCHEHHPFAEDLVNVSDYSNEAHLICNLHTFFYFTGTCVSFSILIAFVPAIQNLEMM